MAVEISKGQDCVGEMGGLHPPAASVLKQISGKAGYLNKVENGACVIFRDRNLDATSRN